ncbi:UNVERIFIED_CONTAM: hypothetical protein NCL1_48782 [Trichonephila clavipes]
MTSAQQVSNYFINGEGLLCHLSKRPSRSPKSNTTRKQVCFPHCLKAKILESIHSEYRGHLKFFKTYHRLSENFFCQNMFKDTKNFVRSCTVCLSRKNSFKIPPGPHQPVEQTQEPGETVHGTSLFSICRNLRDQLNFLFIVDGLQTFDVLPTSTGDSSTHRGRTTAFNVLPNSTGDSSTNCGRTADLLLCCPAGAPNFLRSIDASAIFLVGTHMITELSSRDGTLFFFFHTGCIFCAVYLREQRIDVRPEFPNLELTPEMTWNLFAIPRTRCGEIPFGGVRQESSRVKKVH